MEKAGVTEEALLQAGCKGKSFPMDRSARVGSLLQKVFFGCLCT